MKIRIRCIIVAILGVWSGTVQMYATTVEQTYQLPKAAIPASAVTLNWKYRMSSAQAKSGSLAPWCLLTNRDPLAVLRTNPLHDYEITIKDAGGKVVPMTELGKQREAGEQEMFTHSPLSLFSRKKAPGRSSTCTLSTT